MDLRSFLFVFRSKKKWNMDLHVFFHVILHQNKSSLEECLRINFEQS